MAGDAASSLEYVDHLKGKINDEVAAQIGWIQAILPAPYFVHAHLSDPAEVLKIADPGDQFPLVKAMWHYARGVAFAAQGEPDQARNESAAIATLNQNSNFDMLLAWAVPAPDLLWLAQHIVEARIAQAEGDLDKTVREFEVAVSIQDSIAYMEPPYWYYPVRQSLGAALLAAGKPAEAEKIFKQSLEQSPNNGWALYGLAQAQRAQGDMDVAAATEQQFQQAWHGESSELDLKRL
jgi:tetratricopeptide (TPR) repeat protein